MIKILLKAILFVPLILIGGIALFIGTTLENLYCIYKDRRLPLLARIKWYAFYIPPKTCPDCGDKLKACGYNTRYYCKSCDKDWANKGSF